MELPTLIQLTELNNLEKNMKMETSINESKTHREHINPDFLTRHKEGRGVSIKKEEKLF